jgi:hypothetical protein
VETYYDYLRQHSQELGARILELYPPVQGPDDPLAPEIASLLRKPLPAQAITISGLAKALESSRSVRIVGECGTGKTLMSMGVAHAHAKGRPYSAISMCPPHLVYKWAREVFQTIPRARVFVIYDLRNGGDKNRPHGVVEVQLQGGEKVVNKGLKTTLYDLRKLGRDGWHKRYRVPTFFVVSKETGKLSYFWKHAYSVPKSGPNEGAITGPDSGHTLNKAEGGILTRVDFDDRKVFEHFTRDHKGKHVCGGTQNFCALWQADRTKIQRMAPLGYIGRYMKGWFDYAIADELHQLAQESAQGNNLGVLHRCSRKLIGLTGTLMGGYADDLFHVFYRMEPRVMVGEGFAAGSAGRRDFTERFGVLETIEKTEKLKSRACTKAETVTSRQVRKPGSSPLVFGKFLMASTAFVTLEDIAEYLPSYEESVLEVDMDATLAKAYDGIEEDIREALRKHRGNRSLMSLMMHRLLLYPDHPFGIDAIYGKAFNPESKQVEEFFVTDSPDLDENALYPKEVKLIEDIREEIRQGRRCQVYVTFTGEHDVAGRLERILGNAGFRVSVLRPTVPTLKREDWYINQVRAGVDVVICHPKLVETGLDLLAFPTLYFYETGYSLHTLRQASRRSWRIGQRHPVRVKFLVYRKTTQTTCLKLMGKKMLVALMLEGKFSGEGIHSQEADDDMLTAMARELVERGGVGETAGAIWADLRRERALRMPEKAHVEIDSLDDLDDNSLPFSRQDSEPSLTLVHSNPKPKQESSTLWPTGFKHGDQLSLFG